MAGRRTYRMPWSLTWTLFATVASSTTTIAPANSSTGLDYGGTINLQETNGKNMTTLLPLAKNATTQNLSGALFYTTDNNSGNMSQSDIAYISCDPSDYPGNIQVQSVLGAVYDSGKAAGAILFSTNTNYCNYTNDDGRMSQFAIYSTTDMGAAKSLKDDLAVQSAGTKLFVRVMRSGTQDNGSSDSGSGGTQPQNPLGPSPSTAVAMIILYSITGVITALFLVIIITGAVRAHRHPDRYGPRDVMGRPRQSRARGLGMAILDTIPIVKFGEREQPKPTDVELASTSEARNVNTATANAETTTPASTEAQKDATPTDAPREAGTAHVEGLDSGIAPAQPIAAAPVPQEDASADDALGCSICTDDFEKGQDIRVLPCNHKFHPECVDPWLLNVSGTCPLCRVDLRPTASNTSTSTTSHTSTPDALAPPLQSDAEPSTPNRRHSTLRHVLSFRSRPNASADERISALRRLREQRQAQTQSGEEASANGSSEDVVGGAQDRERDRRRSKRMSLRLSDVFGARRRASPEADQAEASSSSSPPVPVQARTDEAPSTAAEDTTAGAENPNAAARS